MPSTSQILVKTPFLRRPITVSYHEGDAGVYRMLAKGFVPLDFRADDLPEALAEALRRVGNLVRDPHYQPVTRASRAQMST